MTTTTTTEPRPYRLGVWNSAGAQVLGFATEAERDTARRFYSRAGFITWSLSCTTTP